jgi:predicted nucleotidyltransferase
MPSEVEASLLDFGSERFLDFVRQVADFARNDRHRGHGGGTLMATARLPKARSASLEEILALLREHLPELSRKYRVKSLRVFGSYVRGAAGKRSDLDILVEYTHPPDIFGFMDLEEELSAITGVKVELTSAGALRGNIGRRILQEVVQV